MDDPSKDTRHNLCYEWGTYCRHCAISHVISVVSLDVPPCEKCGGALERRAYFRPTSPASSAYHCRAQGVFHRKWFSHYGTGRLNIHEQRKRLLRRWGRCRTHKADRRRLSLYNIRHVESTAYKIPFFERTSTLVIAGVVYA